MAVTPSASYSITVRLEIANRPGMLGKVASAIGAAGGDIGAVDLVESARDRVVRDMTIKARDGVHGQQIVNRVKQVTGVRVVNVSDDQHGTAVVVLAALLNALRIVRKDVRRLRVVVTGARRGRASSIGGGRRAWTS